MRREGEMRLHKNRPTYFKQLGNLDCDQPGHCKMLKAGRAEDQIESFLLLEVGRQTMRIADNVDIASGIVIESDILRLRKLLPCVRRPGHFSTADLKDPQTLLVSQIIDKLPPAAMGNGL